MVYLVGKINSSRFNAISFSRCSCSAKKTFNSSESLMEALSQWNKIYKSLDWSCITRNRIRVILLAFFNPVRLNAGVSRQLGFFVIFEMIFLAEKTTMKDLNLTTTKVFWVALSEFWTKNFLPSRFRLVKGASKWVVKLHKNI